MMLQFAAGFYEQRDGWVCVTVSRHTRVDLAKKAAISLLKKLMRHPPHSGGEFTWSTWYFDGKTTVEVRRQLKP